MRRTLDLEEHRHLRGRCRVQRVRVHCGELHALLEAIARDVTLHVLDHAVHARDHVVTLRRRQRIGQAQHGVAHDQRRLGRVEHDDRLALPRTADLLDRAPRRLGELVDVGAGTRTGRAGRDRRDDLAVVHRDDRSDRGHDRDRRLSAAGDHVDVRRIEVFVEVDCRDDVRSDSRGRQVDEPLAGRRQPRGIGDVRTRRGRIEHDADLVEGRQVDQSVDTVGCDRHVEPGRACQPVRGRVDADHRRHLERR